MWLRLLLLLLLTAAACTPSDRAAAPNAVPTISYERLEALAVQRYGENAGVLYQPSEAGTHVLVQHHRAATPQQPVVATSYFVYAVAQDRVVFEEQAVRGTVAWHDARYLRVRLTPGIVPAEGAAPDSYLVDVRTGRRVPEAAAQ